MQEIELPPTYIGNEPPEIHSGVSYFNRAFEDDYYDVDKLSVFSVSPVVGMVQGIPA